jgi:ribosome-binding factor A
MKVSHRAERVARLLKEEIARVIQRELRDPSIGFTTVTDVILTPDLRHADVYVTILGGEEEKRKGIETLNKAQSFIRRVVAKELNLKNNPTFTFYLDESFERGERIEKILEEIRKENAEKRYNKSNR